MKTGREANGQFDNPGWTKDHMDGGKDLEGGSWPSSSGLEV